MSTRSFICVAGEESGVRGIYCHYDGYPEHVGKILVEHHNSIGAAEKLIGGPQIRNFDHDGTVGRFGDGPSDASEIYDTKEEALNSGFDYFYQFSRKTNSWKCFGRRDGAIVECEIPSEK